MLHLVKAYCFLCIWAIQTKLVWWLILPQLTYAYCNIKCSHHQTTHRGLCAVVVENNSCEWIRGPGDVSWSQVSVVITRQQKDNRTDQYTETSQQTPLNCQRGQILSSPLDLILSKLNPHSWGHVWITQCQVLRDMLISALPESERL